MISGKDIRGRWLGWLATVALAVAALGAGSQARAERRHALVIGANPGWSQDRPLRHAEHDAERIRDVLVALGGFMPGDVELLRDPDAAEIRAALRRLDQITRGGDSLVFVYYSGHADDRHLHLRGEPPLSHSELQDTLRALPATIKLAVIDACKSGAVTRKGGSQAREFQVDVVTPKLSGLVVLTSSGADELSQESRALAGSVFTHHLVSGLRGAADGDGDQRVTVAEAYHHAYERTRADTAITGAQQRPAFRYELSGQGELVLTQLATGKQAQLRVPRGGASRYVVLDAYEWRLIAEVSPERDRDVVLALAPGRYRIKRVFDDRLEVASVELAPGTRGDLGDLAYVRAPLSSGIVKGEPSDLSPVEFHEWSRARAFGMLADGQAATALDMFDHLVRQAPNDALAWRGRGRALVRIAEAYQRVGDQTGERRALNDALGSDPSLSHDPEFQRRYQFYIKRDADVRAEADARRDSEQDRHDRPRRTRRLGIGAELFGARGLLGLSGTVVTRGMVFSRLVFDLAEPGFDTSVVVVPMASRWSPYGAIGFHVSLGQLGIDVPGSMSSYAINDDAELGQAIFDLHARLELGAQFVGKAGFITEVGLGVMAYRHPDDGRIVAGVLPVFHFGWLF